jgi:23S rRNA (uracil1939-C5)-methyltransferase
LTEEKNHNIIKYNIANTDMKKMIKKNDILKLEITDVSFAGLGVARYSDDEIENFIIFVHNAIPQDVIMCRIVKTEKTFAYGIIDKMISGSKNRINVPCDTFEKCGGCVYLNMDYKNELEIKRQAVINAFKRHMKSFPDPLPAVPSPEIENYRNKVVCPLSMNGKFGFYARASHRNIENNACFLQDADFEKYLTATEQYVKDKNITPYNETSGTGLFRQLYLRKAKNTGEICVCAVINGKKLPYEEEFAELMEKTGASSVYVNENTTHGNTVLGRNFRLIRGKERITDTLCDIEYEISPRAFYQINSRQAENLYKYAVSLADINGKDTVLDLFCGIGTISLIAAKAGAKRVVGIEIIEEAIDDAQKNARINNIYNAEFYAADAADTLKILEKCGGTPNTVIVDPPRKGLGVETVNAIAQLSPEKIVYISCNPETQAKDIVSLAEYGYSFNSIQPFDMFPRTQHVETVCCLYHPKKDFFSVPYEPKDADYLKNNELE